MTDPVSIQTEADYAAALAEVERLWGAKKGTISGNYVDRLATLIEAYEDRHYPMGSRSRSLPNLVQNARNRSA